MEQRTLVAAYRFYCAKQLDGAHSADADTRATYEVLKAQLDRYKDAPYVDHDGKTSYPIQNDIAALSTFSGNPQWADLVGHIGYDKSGREVFNFGKYKGRRLEEVFATEPSYYAWMQNADFPLSTKRVVKKVYARVKANRKQQEMLNALKMKLEGR